MTHQQAEGYPGTGAWVITQFGDGIARVWEDEAKLPRVKDIALQSVVYLFQSVDDAKSSQLVDPYGFAEDSKTGTARAASGCLVQVVTQRKLQPEEQAARTPVARPFNWHFYVVTNRHVVKGGGCVVPRFSFKDPNGDSGYFIDAVEDDWYCDLLETDLAVLPVHDETVRNSIYGIDVLPWDISHDVHVGDDVAMPGRFFPVSGGPTNCPVTRFGNIARWPATQINLPRMSPGRTSDAILAEMRSHSGYSGSPAFVFEGLHRKLNDRLDRMFSQFRDHHKEDVDWPDMRFLGIDCGHFSGNMAIIIPWFKVQELLRSPTLVQLRKQRDESLPPTVIPD